MKTPAERKEEARREKLAEIQEQVDSGGLVIRPMTKAERKQFPPKPESARKRPGGRGGSAPQGRR